MEDYLNRNGLYPFSTYFFLRTQPRYLSGDDFESNANEAMGTESSSTTEESYAVSVAAPNKGGKSAKCATVLSRKVKAV